jgi:hypothetical protein
VSFSTILKLLKATVALTELHTTVKFNFALIEGSIEKVNIVVECFNQLKK